MMKTMFVEGMMCPRCVAHVKKALEVLDPKVEVVLEENCAKIYADVDNEALTEARAASYDARAVESLPAHLLDKYFVAGIFRTALDTGTANSTPRSTIGYANIPAVDSSRTIGIKLDVKFGE